MADLNFVANIVKVIGAQSVKAAIEIVETNLEATRVNYNSVAVKSSGTISIADVKTFTDSPVVPTPTTDYQTSTKKYVDDEITENVSVTGFHNLTFTATAAAAALTVALKGDDGADPSADNVAKIKFRSTTLTENVPVTRSVSAALSVVLASGGTLGFIAAEPGRIYVWAIDNAGTVELALSRTANIFPESNLVTTVAIGAGSDLSTAMYSTAQRTDLACRCLGYIDITTGAVEGEWDNAATKLQLMLPGIKRTGDIVQRQYVSTSVLGSGTTAIPFDDTIPAITEGVEAISLAITPTNIINTLKIDSSLVLACASEKQISVALFQDAVSAALKAVPGFTGGAQAAGRALTHAMRAGTVAETTFKLRVGAQDATSIDLNGYAGSRIYGGVSGSYLQIKEIEA